MNWKLVLIGAIVFWLVTNIFAMFVTGYIIHNSILNPVYRAHESFWIAPLRQDPPDMMAVLPSWLLMSFISSLVVAGIYSCVYTAFRGPGWKRGLVWGLCLGIFTCATYMNFTGLFDLPTQLWVWWGVDALFLFLIGGAAMGWAGQKFANAPPPA